MYMFLSHFALHLYYSMWNSHESLQAHLHPIHQVDISGTSTTDLKRCCLFILNNDIALLCQMKQYICILLLCNAGSLIYMVTIFRQVARIYIVNNRAASQIFQISPQDHHHCLHHPPSSPDSNSTSRAMLLSESASLCMFIYLAAGLHYTSSTHQRKNS